MINEKNKEGDGEQEGEEGEEGERGCNMDTLEALGSDQGFTRRVDLFQVM